MKSRLAILMAERDPRMKQRELAEKSGVSAMAVNRLYNNEFKRVDTETLEKLCAYLECDLSELLVLKEEQHPRKNSVEATAHSTPSAQTKPGNLQKGSMGIRNGVSNEQQQTLLEESLQFELCSCKQPHSKAIFTTFLKTQETA